MSTNLSNIIEYINDNFKYGSIVDIRDIDSLIDKYNINEEETQVVFKELNDLEIEIKYSKKIIEQKINNLFKFFDKNQEIKKSELLFWFREDKVDSYLQTIIINELNKLNYTIINDVQKQVDYEGLDFLDDLDEMDLNKLLEDDEFKKELSEYEEVISQKNNIEYIETYQKSTNIKLKEQALENIVAANEKLVWKMVTNYKHHSTKSFDLDDMYQEGMIGLLKAAEKFDLDTGNQLSTYAIYWIRQSILRAIGDYSTTIRVPIHMRENISKFNYHESIFWNENLRLPSIEEMAQLLDTTEDKIVNIINARKIANLTSLETPVGEDQSTTIGEFIEDDKIITPEEYSNQKVIKNEINLLMKEYLTEREIEVMNLRFGLNGENDHTLEQIGKQFGVTRERIRQIEAKAIGKLQRPKPLGRFKVFINDN